MTFIGENAFAQCIALKWVKVENAYPANITLGNYVFVETTLALCKLYVPEGSMALYKAAPQWMDFGSFEEYDPAAGVGSVVKDSGDAVYYDLQGRKVKNPARGLQILNGHKVILK